MEPLVVAEEHRSHIASAVALATSFSHTTITEAADRLRLAGIANPGVVMAALVGSSVENALRGVSGNDVEGGGERPPRPSLLQPLSFLRRLHAGGN
jgi:predicted short-subunit dehydrogenase-like oxidoreductase (DUF2520 family)